MGFLCPLPHGIRRVVNKPGVEPCDGKPSRTVLGGGGGREAAPLTRHLPPRGRERRKGGYVGHLPQGSGT